MRILDDFKKKVRSGYSRVLDFLGQLDDGQQEFPVYDPAKEWRAFYEEDIHKLETLLGRDLSHWRMGE